MRFNETTGADHVQVDSISMKEVVDITGEILTHRTVEDTIGEVFPHRTVARNLIEEHIIKCNEDNFFEAVLAEEEIQEV